MTSPPANGGSPRTTPPDNPQDLIGPPTTITGTIASTGRCVILDSASGPWLLTGDPAKTLQSGAEVTVRGRPITPPPDCAAPRALRVDAVG